MTRTRDNSRLILYTHETQWGRRAEGQVSQNPPSVVSVIHPDVMTDVVTPDFKKRSASGYIINSPMTRWKGERTLMPANNHVRWAIWYRRPDMDQWVRTTGEAPVPHAFNPHEDKRVLSVVGRLKALAITSAFANVGSPDVAVLTELAELRETLGFLWSPVRGMVNLTKRFKRYRDKVESILKRDAARLAKWERLPPHIQRRRKKPEATVPPKFSVGRFVASDVSSAWLAYRYGLMPLIYTFQDVEKLLKKQLDGSPIRATARGKETDRVNLYSTVTVSNFWDNNFFNVTKTVDGGATVTVRAGVLYEVDAELMTQLGLQINRIPMALYEAIPLSFVSDWFHNGAEVYDALTAEFRSNKILTAWTSTTIDYDIMFKEAQGPVTQGTGSASGFLSEVRKGKWYKRELATVTDVKFRLRVNLNSKRVADGLALIHTFLSTGKLRK